MSSMATRIIIAACLSLAASPVPAGAFASPGASVLRDDAYNLLAVAETAAAERNGPKGDYWAKRVREERAKFLSALQWLVSNQQDEAALRLVGALGWFWDYEFVEGGREWLNKILALPGAQAPTLARSKALLYAGVLAFRMGDQAAANKQIEESLAIAREEGDRTAQAQALSALARNALRDENHRRVQTLANEAMKLAEQMNDRRSAASARHMLAYSAAMQGQLDRAQLLYEENIRVGRDLGDKALIANETGNLAFLQFDRKNFEAARDGFLTYLRMMRDSGDNAGMADALLGLGMVEVGSANSAKGARTLGAVQAAFRSLGIEMDPGSRKDFDQAVLQAKEQLGAEAFARAFSQGEKIQLEQAVTVALDASQRQ